MSTYSPRSTFAGGATWPCSSAGIATPTSSREWPILGFEFVRGSTRRGGVAAIRELLRRGRRMHLAITPDGPAGRRTLALGDLPRLEARTPPRGHGLRFRPPLAGPRGTASPFRRPFSRARAVVSPDIRVPADLDREGIEHFRRQVEGLLNRLTDEAELWAASGTRLAGQRAVTPPPALSRLHRGRLKDDKMAAESSRRFAERAMTQFELFPEEPEEPEEPEQDASPERPWTVSELTAAIKDLLETAFPAVWVSGEISNFSRPRSGHCYLTLKDEGAQISAVIWRATAARVPFELHDGLEVVCGATLSLYPPHGKYQLVIEEIQPKGIGALELALRQLRDKLAREGLFDPGRKRSLPRFVRRIAVVTSPTGAAIRDFLEVLRRRWRGADVLVVPVRVQGEGAGHEIAAAIEAVNRIREPIDFIVVTAAAAARGPLGSTKRLFAAGDLLRQSPAGRLRGGHDRRPCPTWWPTSADAQRGR